MMLKSEILSWCFLLLLFQRNKIIISPRGRESEIVCAEGIMKIQKEVFYIF